MEKAPTPDDPYANIRKTNNQTKDWALVTSQVYEGRKSSIYDYVCMCMCVNALVYFPGLGTFLVPPFV